MSHKAERVDVRLILEGEEAKEFLEYKKEVGAKAHVEAVRVALSQAYKVQRVKLQAVPTR